jgi:large subunit ribosomal protein L22
MTRATLRYDQASPTKVRQVLDLVRGLDVAEAREILRFSQRAASVEVAKLLDSAIATPSTTTTSQRRALRERGLGRRGSDRQALPPRARAAGVPGSASALPATSRSRSGATPTTSCGSAASGRPPPVSAPPPSAAAA